MLVISSIPLIVIAALGALAVVAKSPRESANGSHTLGTESI